MNTTIARARLLTALLMLAGSLSVVLVAQGATAAPSYSVNLTVSDSRPDVGETLRLSGKVRPAAPGKVVRVQGKAAGTGWVTIKKVRLSKASTYKAAFRLPAAGRLSIRIVKPKSRTVARGVSRARNIRVGDRLTAPVLVPATLPAAAVGSAYSATIETTDNRPGAFTIGAGSLPTGLSLHDQTGVISGSPTAQGTFNFTVVFRDPDGLSDTEAYAITVGQAVPAPVISTTTLPPGSVSAAYSATLETVGNKTGTWSVTVGALPAGLSLNSATGVISGTPTTAATTSFTVRFAETATGLADTQALSITIAEAGPPTISTTTLPPGAVTKPYTATLQTVGDRSGVWAKTAGSFPAGLSLNAWTGVISGTPTAAGTQTFTIRFTQVGGLTDSQVLSITVDPNTAPVITTTSLPAGEVGAAYPATTLHTQNNRTGTWAVGPGSLPAGLALNGATGVITGTPTTQGTTNFTVVFTTTGGLTDSQPLSIAIAPATAPVISTVSMPAGTVGQAYSKKLETVGNRAGTWALSGSSLPAGLALNSATGVVSGSPSTAGTTSFTVIFTATTGLTDSQALSIVVDPSTPPQISTTTLPGGVVDAAYSITLETNGNRTGTWSVSGGALPAGLALAPATGVISGTPTGPAGTTSFIVLFTATGGLTDSQPLSIAVAAAP